MNLRKIKHYSLIIVILSGFLASSSTHLNIVPAQAADASSYPDAMTIHFEDGVLPVEVSQFHVPQSGNESVCDPAPSPWEVQWSRPDRSTLDWEHPYVVECESGDKVFALYPFYITPHLVPGPFDQAEMDARYQVCQDENGANTRYCTWDELLDYNSTANTISWTQIEGPSVKLSGPDRLYPSFIAPDVKEPTHLKFRSVADDGFSAQIGIYDILIKPTESKFDISFSAFIPAPYLKAPPQFSCFSQTEGKRVDLYLHGDGRDFDPGSNSYRVKQLVSAVTGSDSDGIKDGTRPQNLVGTSKAYAKDALADGKIDASDDDNVLNDCHLLHQVATASNSGMHIDVKKIDSKKTQVHIFGAAALPIKPEAPLPGGPDIDWDFTILLDTGGKAPSWELTGKHDGFPAYELYINNKPIYQYTPGSGPYTLSQISKLFPPMDVSVSKGGTL